MIPKKHIFSAITSPKQNTWVDWQKLSDAWRDLPSYLLGTLIELTGLDSMAAWAKNSSPFFHHTTIRTQEHPLSKLLAEGGVNRETHPPLPLPPTSHIFDRNEHMALHASTHTVVARS